MAILDSTNGELFINDIKDNSIYVLSTITRNVHDKEIIGGKTKTQKSKRITQIAPITQTIIDNVKKNYIPNKPNLLFCDGTKKAYYIPGNVNDYLRRLNDKYNIAPELHNHMLRHTFATRCIESGSNVKYVQQKLGHADLETTLDTYCDIFDSYEYDEDNKLNEFFVSTFFENDNKIVPFKKEA